MFDPDLFWQFAEIQLNGSAPDECKSRIAAGRAYYAFFLTLRDRFENNHKEKFAHDATDHSLVVRLLQKRNREPMVQALRQLMRLREESDYQMNSQIDFRRVSVAIEQARPHYINSKTI